MIASYIISPSGQHWLTSSGDRSNLSNGYAYPRMGAGGAASGRATVFLLMPNPWAGRSRASRISMATAG
ncbi:MAG: hypothetical protein DMF90_25930 [Acidobacteria bacterium]|nr:MAG: hypothetical protein DMF90_25930 [Acidobacteriota bacterium]